MDEFDLSLHYIEGKQIFLADCFSRLSIIEKSVPMGDSINDINNKCKRNRTHIDFPTIKVPKDYTMIDDKWFFNLEELYVRDEQINNSNN